MADDIRMKLNYDVEINAPLTVRAPITLLMEGDKNANVIVIRLTQNGEPLDVTGCTVDGSVDREDGHPVGITGTAEGNVVTAVLNEYSYAVPGTFGAYVRLYDPATTVRRTILLLAGYVQPRGHGQPIDTGVPLPSLDNVIAQLQTMVQVTNDAIEAAERANAAADSVAQLQIDANGLAKNALALEGHPASYFLPATGTAADSSKLGGQLPSYYLPATGTAADSSKLGGVSAADYALKAPNNYAYDGKDLSTVFASAAELHAAVSVGDFSKIRVGDYWPITLNGSYMDYGDNTTKDINTLVKMEVGAIDIYMNFGDSPITSHHLVMCSRDLLPNTTKWRSGAATWHDSTQTNPWLGSAIYATLNAGILPLVQATNIGPYLYAGPNGNGMRFLGENKPQGEANPTSPYWGWMDRGRVFLPFEHELWGRGIWSDLTWGANPALQWQIFSASFRHVLKGIGNGGNRSGWWLASSFAGNATSACYVAYGGNADHTNASDARGLAICCLLA